MALSCAIIFLSPGLGCWRALAEGMDISVRVEGLNMREPVAVPGMNFSPSDNNVIGDALGIEAIDSISRDEVNAIPMGVNAEQSRTLPLIGSNLKPVAGSPALPSVKNIAAPFHRASAALGKKIEKIRQIVSSTVNGSQQFFDGMFLQPDYALAMPSGKATQNRKASVLSMNATLDESAFAGKDSNQPVTQPPAPNDDAALKAQIDQAIAKTQSVISLSDSSDAKQALTALEKDPSSMDSGNLEDLAMAPALAFNTVKSVLIPMINKIAGRDLRAKDLQEKIALLNTAGKSAAKDMLELSGVITRIAEVLETASRTQEAAQWREIVATLRNQSAALEVALPALSESKSVLTMRQDFKAYWDWARRDADAANRAINIALVALAALGAYLLFTPSTAHAAGFLTGFGPDAAFGGIIAGVGAMFGIVMALAIASLIGKLFPSFPSVGPTGALLIPCAIITLGGIVGVLITGFLL